jgi:hypothetical protein
MFEKIKLKLNDVFADIADFINDFRQVKYSDAGWNRFNEARGKGITFKATVGEKSVTMYTDELPGLYIAIPLSAKSTEILEVIDDSLMVYFGVPRRLLKKVKLASRLVDLKTNRVIADNVKSGIYQYKSK